MPEEPRTIVKVRSLKKYFELKKGLLSAFSEETPVIKAVDDVNFGIREGEILGLVGESGCGKTTTGRLLTRLEDPTGGSVIFMGRDIALLEGKDIKTFRRNIQMVFQDPYESLNPRTTVLQTVMEPLINHNIGDTPEERVELVVKALEDAGLAPAREYLDRFPHELSGGQRQRVSVARALVIKPKVIVADEPVSMLDVSIRAGVLNLMLDLRDKYRIPYLFITHDIAVARYVSDRLGVMYLGRVVEIGETDEVIFHAKHPYTQALLSAVPVPDPAAKHSRIAIKGEIPSAANVPLGCRFRPRCPKAFRLCGWQGEDLADWLLKEEKVNSPEHPVKNHVDELKPDGFALVIAVKPEGKAREVQAFLQSTLEKLKDTNPMFAAIESIATSVGNKEIVVNCSSARISDEELAHELYKKFVASVDFRAADHPLHGTIVDMKLEGHTIVLDIGEDVDKTISPEETKAQKTKAILLDFIKHYRRRGLRDFKGVRGVEIDKSGKKVTIECSPARKSSKDVAREVADVIGTEFVPRRGGVLPVRTRRGRAIVRVTGGADGWEDIVKQLVAFLSQREMVGELPAGSIKSVLVKGTKGPKDLVVVKFITSQEPPLIDTGGGHEVACYLYGQGS